MMGDVNGTADVNGMGEAIGRVMSGMGDVNGTGDVNRMVRQEDKGCYE